MTAFDREVLDSEQWRATFDAVPSKNCRVHLNQVIRKGGITLARAARQACSDPGPGDPQALAHDEPDDAVRCRAERDADADLPRPSRDEVRDGAVEADHREEEREQTARRHQRRRQPLGAERLLHVPAQRPRGKHTATSPFTAALVARTAPLALYGVTPLDPRTYGGVLVLLTITAILAAYVPARRAVRIDPARALSRDRQAPATFLG